MKKILLLLTFSLFVIAAGNIFFVTNSILQPSERARSQRSVHDTATLSNGDYRFDSFDRESAWNDRVLLLIDWDGVQYVYLIPTKNGSVPMPDRFWGWGWHDCLDFRPEEDAQGKIEKGGVIKCHDQGISTNNWEWYYDGSPKYWWLPEIYAPEVEVVGDKVFINK